MNCQAVNVGEDVGAVEGAIRESAALAEHDSKDAASARAEAGLYSEEKVIKEQVRRLGPLNDEENLLHDPEKKSPGEDKGTGGFR